MTTLIVGSSRGIGLSVVRALVARGDQVIAACRTPTPELSATGVEIVADVDVASSAGLDPLRTRFADAELHHLWVVAGILERNTLTDPLDEESIRRQFEVNALGPLRVVAALAPRMTPGGKIALLTSRMGSIADNTSGGHYGYRMSKAALNMAGASLARDLRSRELAVAILHPGFVRTDMTAGQGLIDAETSATGLIARVDELTLASSGTFWHQSGEVLPW